VEGTVVRVIEDKGFGFVKQDAVEFFFHGTDVVGGYAVFITLQVGQIVTFDEAASARGPRACNVRLTNSTRNAAR
jgi:cold shock protein